MIPSSEITKHRRKSFYCLSFLLHFKLCAICIKRSHWAKSVDTNRISMKAYYSGFFMNLFHKHFDHSSIIHICNLYILVCVWIFSLTVQKHPARITQTRVIKCTNHCIVLSSGRRRYIAKASVVRSTRTSTIAEMG